MLGGKELLIFQLEIRHLFAHNCRFHFIPLFIIGVFFIAWVYSVASPFVPVMVVVLCGLELQFNNLLFRTSSEFETYLLFPISWRRVIIMKNLATIALTFLLFIVGSMSLLYFSPATIKFIDVRDAVLYLVTIIFPMLQIGNTQSVRHPRRISGLQINDFIEAIWTLLNVAIVSVPYYVIMKLIEIPFLCLVYGPLTMIIWWRFSIDRTAEQIMKNQFELCSTQ
jgi:hypothetical protein